MGLLGDEEHPDQACTALHKILDVIVFLIGVALIVFAAYYMNALKAASFFSIIMLVLGIGLISISIVGMFGSGYYKGGEKEGRLICLRIFWLAVLLFAVICFIFGGICLASQETIQSYVLTYYSQFTDMTNQFGGQAGAMMQQLTALLNNFKILGGVALGIGFFLLLCFLSSSSLMGVRIFLLTCAMFGSIGIAIIGGIIIALSAYFQSYTAIMASISKILFGGIILGIISIVIGAVGLVAYWLHKKLPIVLTIFTFVVLALGAAYLVVGIVSFSLVSSLDNNGSLLEKVNEHCSEKVVEDEITKELFAEESPCYNLTVNAITYECQRVRNGEMSDDICPFLKKKNESAVCPLPPNTCCCAGNTKAFISSMQTKKNFVDFSYLTTKKSVVSNYKILGMLCIFTAGLLLFIVGALILYCCSYAAKTEEDPEDDRYEWVWKYDDDEEGDD